ncbi:MAG: hypothetical protein ACRDRN_19615 [Sciscionella sp.]
MASVEEVRAGIALASEKARGSMAALAEAATALEESQAALVSSTQGSANDEIAQAHGLLAEALQNISGVQGTISAGISAAESYSGHL